MRVVRLLAVACLLLFPEAARAQGPLPIPSRLSVYLDCRTGGCDGSLIRTEVTWVDWVRDQGVADVHLLITSQGAGAGGSEYTLTFMGARLFAGRADTLRFTTNPTTTDDERRRGVLQVITVGLVPYAARTGTGRSLRISADTTDGVAKREPTNPADDPWNAWVFEIGVDGFMNGERYYKGRDFGLNLEANRVTEQWKTSFDFRYSYRDNSATVLETDSTGAVTGEETYTSLQRDWSTSFGQVKSLGQHWAAGTEVEVASQTFRNQDLRYQLRAAVEYNLFPYSEFTRRSFKISYGLGYTGYHYADTTVFDKISETLPSHFIEASYRTRQSWGNVNLNFEHRNFLTDASKRSTDVNGNFSVRLFKGFSVNAGAGYSWIHDQVYLPRGEQDAVDVLLRRRALLTGFEYFTHFGVSYTFGSIFNNVVNPRF
jgi:hypothetical protein